MRHSFNNRDDLCPPDKRSVIGKGPVADAVLLSALFLFEISLALIALTSYRISLKPSAVSFLQSRTGYLFATAVLGLVASGVTIIYRYYQDNRVRAGAFKMTVAMNIVTMLILVTVGEGAIRAFYKESPTGDMLGGTYLYDPPSILWTTS